jgi:hypothetical protein
VQPFLHIAAKRGIVRKGEWSTAFSPLLKTALKLSFCIFAIGLFLATETSAATVTNRVTGAANWNTAGTWIQNCTGTVTFTNASQNVTGVGTAFLTELSVGDVLMLQATPGTVRGTIASITSNTQLTLVANAGANANGAYGRQQVPGSSDDVVIGNTNLAAPAVTITLDAASATVNSFTFTATTVANSLTHSGTNTLTVSNNVTVNQPTANAITVAWNINGGTGTVNGNVTIGGATATASRVARIAVTTGSLSFAGAVNYTANTSAATEVITVSTGSISFSNALTLSSGTLSVTSTGTINLNGGLSFGSANTPSFSTVANSNINFGGSLTATTTALTFIATSNTTFTANSNITPTAAITFGRLKVNSGVTATLAGNVIVAGNLTVDGTLAGAFTTTLSVSATTVAGNNGTVAGSITTAVAHSVTAGTVLTIQTNFSITAAVTVTNNGSMTIQGNLTGSAAGSTWTNAANSLLTAGGALLTTGTLTASANPNTVTYNSTTAAQTVKGTTYYNLVINKSGQTGTQGAATTVSNDLTISAGTLSTAAFTLGVAGNFVVNGTLSGTGAIMLSGASKNIDGTGSITNTATLTINAAHTILATANLSCSGTIAIVGAVTVTNNGAITTSAAGGITGSVAGSTWINAANSTLNIAGPLLATGTLDASANPNTVNYNGAAQTVKAATYYHLIFSGSAAKTAGGALTVNGNFTVAGTATFAAGTSLTHTFSGNWIVNTTAAAPFSFTTSSTLNFNTPSPAGVTSISGTSAATLGFNTVNLNNTNGFSSSLNFGISGTLTVAANVIFTPASAVVISGVGTLTGSGTVQVIRATGASDFANQYTITNKTLTNLTVEFAGASAQGNGTNIFGGLKINNSSGLTLSGNATVNGTLTLASGNITTSANKVIISSTGIVSRTSGHVFGNLQKNVATGATSLTFEVGDASNYTPVIVSFASVTTAGDLIASTTSGDHPNIGTSNILSSKSVNRYWTLTNGGIAFTTYSATFNFVAGDLDSGANTSAFIVGKYTAGTWSYPTVGTRTATSTQATGLSAFGDFQLGEQAPPNISLVKSVSPSSPQPPDTDLAYSVIFTNSGSGAAQSLIIIDPNPTNVDPAQRAFANVDYKLGSASISFPWSATIGFSNDGGSTWSYAPVSGGGGAPSGYDRAVTNIRWSVTGNVAASANGTLSFTVRIQ